MLVLISPAKRLDFSPLSDQAETSPLWPDAVSELAAIARGKSPGDLRRLMGLSEDLARLNYDRFRVFGDTSNAVKTKQAMYAFAGDTYLGLDAASLEADAVAYAQDHLRILSGLYGLLRPLDMILPYRLEMGTRLENPKGTTLYAYWADRIAPELNAQASKLRTEFIVNCASVEYFTAANTGDLRPTVITPVFLDEKNGEAKIISFFAKKARGAMARYIVERRLSDPEALCDFDTGGYVYAPERSTPEAPVFFRSEAAAQAA
ncbi:MAG: peroxide stress protein YaaA [Pseudomonadota bacterium]